jgi:hypothetical protein
MAISAVSAIGGGSSMYRAEALGVSRSSSHLSRVENVPALRGRSPSPGEEEGLDPAQREKEAARLLAKDPRGSEAIIARRGEIKRAMEGADRDKKAAAETSKREIKDRLDELMGEKSSMERKRAEDKGARSAEVVSELSQLKSRDSEVRAHESAHMASGGRYITGGASYTYQKGPDGGQYAIGGEVGIDSSPVSGKPEETAAKMRIVRAAALAPSDPSAADLSVAAAAAQAEAAALADIARARSEAAVRAYGAGGADRSGISKPALDMVA